MNENKKILEQFRNHIDEIVAICYIILGVYILFLGITTNINFYLKIALIFGGVYFLWMGYYTYKEYKKVIKNE